MKLKLDAAGNAVLHKEGDNVMPIYIKDDGAEVPFDAPGTVNTIARLRGESAGHKKRADDTATALTAFEGIKDPKAAMAALETVANIGHGKLVDAGQVEKVKAEVAKVYEGQLAEASKTRDSLMQELYAEKVGGAFMRSPLINDPQTGIFTIPPDVVQAMFGKHFVLKDNKVVGLNSAGGEIFSETRPGEVATFDEALKTLVNAYANKDRILKGTNATGGGAPASGGGAGGGGKRTITRAAFDTLDPTAKAQAAKEAIIVD